MYLPWSGGVSEMLFFTKPGIRYPFFTDSGSENRIELTLH
jgi:hypothetical protein